MSNGNGNGNGNHKDDYNPYRMDDSCPFKRGDYFIFIPTCTDGFHAGCGQPCKRHCALIGGETNGAFFKEVPPPLDTPGLEDARKSCSYGAILRWDVDEIPPTKTEIRMAEIKAEKATAAKNPTFCVLTS